MLILLNEIVQIHCQIGEIDVYKSLKALIIPAFTCCDNFVIVPGVLSDQNIRKGQPR